MTTQDIAIDEKRKSLYNYWHKLPYFKTMDTLNLSQVEESEVSSFIIKCIRDGIEDEFGRTNNLSRRHAFSAKELHTAYTKKWKDQNYSLSNFHFHINNLVEDGYLQEIARILENRHYISYYGRTAKAFIGQYDNILTSSTVLETFEPIKQLIKNMNPEISLDTIDQLIDENIISMQDFYYRLFSWIEDKYPLIYKSKIDIKDFLNIVSHFSFFHKEFAKTSQKIGSLLDLDKVMDYERYPIESEKK